MRMWALLGPKPYQDQVALQVVSQAEAVIPGMQGGIRLAAAAERGGQAAAVPRPLAGWLQRLCRQVDVSVRQAQHPARSRQMGSAGSVRAIIMPSLPALQKLNQCR